MARIIQGVNESIEYLNSRELSAEVKNVDITNFNVGGFDALEVRDEGTSDEEIYFRRLHVEGVEPESLEEVTKLVNAEIPISLFYERPNEVLAFSLHLLKTNPEMSIQEVLVKCALKIG